MAAFSTASVAALAYGFFYSFRGEGVGRAVLKMAGIVILALVAFAAGGPWLLWAALAASAVGDLFLAGKPARWLLPGMAAFFLAHVFYVVLFWQLGEGASGPLAVTAAQVVLVFGGAAYIRWLAPWLGKMRMPVFAYGGVILMMGAAAIALPPAYLLVTIGALMFIASDAILAQQLFCRPADAPPNKPASYAVWFLYFFGQAAITWGLLHPAA